MRHVAAVAVLAAAACGRTDAVPAETPEAADGWCVDGSRRMEGFRLENGKTVSICKAAGSSDLTYTYGVLEEEPELVYSGRLLGTFEGLSGFGYAIADLADGFATEFSGPDVSVDAPPEAVAAAVNGSDSRGFFYVHSQGPLRRRGGRLSVQARRMGVCRQQRFQPQREPGHRRRTMATTLTGRSSP